MLLAQVSCRALSAAAALWLVVSVAPAHAQVQFFNRVPTPQEIQAALGVAPTPAPTRAANGEAAPFKTRGLEWNSAPTTQATQTAIATAETLGPALAFPVNFELGDARVSRASSGYIEAMVDSLARNPSLRLVVEGHTDALGNPRNNLMLSWERAFSVFRVMVEKYGVDPNRLQPVGKGANEPLLPGDPLNGMNRRVQFRVLG